MNPRATQVAQLRQLLALRPDDRVAWHNLAAAEGDLGRSAEAEAAARRAIALGIDAPETRLVLARALQSQRKLDEAESMFRKAIALRPAYVEAHRDLAQLVWMRTGNADFALRRLEQALQAFSDAPETAGLHLAKATLLEFAGDRAAALATAHAGLTHAPNDLPLTIRASHLRAQSGDVAGALKLAERAVALVPGDPTAHISLCESYLAVGRAVEAEKVAAQLCAARPLNQYAIALHATAWRLLGDARYTALYDYASLVDAQALEAPIGWSSLHEFLGALATELDSLHSFRAHPLDQSVRGGSQLTLQEAELQKPLIASLFESISKSVQRFMQRIGTGDDPLRSRNTRRAAISGAWSVRLSSGGHHADHVHPHGWISSACYIALPPTIGGPAGDDRAGWLHLGRPAMRTEPLLDAQHFVRPEPGLLVLFPAYMWHGVEAFESDRQRLSVAFDVVPV